MKKMKSKVYSYSVLCGLSSVCAKVITGKGGNIQQGVSYNSEIWCPKLAIIKFFGCSILQVRAQYTHNTPLNMDLHIKP